MSLLKDKLKHPSPVVQKEPEGPRTDFTGDPKEELPREGEVIYALLNGLESYSIQLTSGEVCAVRGQLRMSIEQDQELQALLKKGRPDIMQNIKRLDFDEAERIAKQHMERSQQQASRGASSSSDKHRLAEQLAGDKPRNLDVIEEGVLHGEDASQLKDADFSLGPNSNQ